MSGGQLQREYENPSGAEGMLTQAKPRIDRGAVASVVLGVVGYFPLAILSITALAMGHASHRRIERSGGSLRGRPIALAGAALGWLGTGWSALFWSGEFCCVSSIPLFLGIWVGELVAARMVFLSLRPDSNAREDSPKRSSLALVGLTSTSIATAMSLLAVRVILVRGMGPCNMFSCENQLPGPAGGLFAYSVLLGSVALGMLLFARREITRSRVGLKGRNLVRLGFLLAIVGILSNCLVMLAVVGNSMNSI